MTPRARSLAAASTPGVLVLAATLPVLFLHVNYQPAVSLPFGGLSPTLKLSDAAVLLTVLAAVVAATRGGLRRLRPGLPTWIAAALFLAWIVAATFYPLLSARAYPWKTHLVTAAEFGEYALLAPALPLLLRRRADAILLAGSLVGWSAIATLVGVVQWVGWHGLHAWGRGRRQPSFLGPHDFAALSGAALVLGLVALLWRVESPVLRRGAWVAVGSGLVGFVVGGASAGIIGLVPAVLVAVGIAARRHLLARRTVAAALAAVAVASLGVVVLRAGDFDQFFRFLGGGHPTASAQANIQTYSQRSLLAYIGLRIWEHHPLVGAGWEASGDPATFMRELPAAHARFPHVAPIAFPGPTRPYGVQLLYVQVLADLGVVGLLLLAALVVATLWVGVRTALSASPPVALAATAGVAGLVLALGFWTAEGIVAGIPLDALTWLAVGAACLRPDGDWTAPLAPSGRTAS